MLEIDGLVDQLNKLWNLVNQRFRLLHDPEVSFGDYAINALIDEACDMLKIKLRDCVADCVSVGLLFLELTLGPKLRRRRLSPPMKVLARKIESVK
jgi:hypothetical protein